MTEQADPLWTIDELGSQVALALSVDYEGQASGRVRDIPDRRTIRYYTTLGLLDRASEMRGRTALYGRRHLLQLVAIKRLQTRGLSLAELQQQLVGLTDAALAQLARLPPGVGTPSGQGRTAREEAGGRQANFWKTAPVPLSTSESSGNGTVPNTDPLPLQGIRLDDDVTLLLSPARPLEPDDIEALRVVAAPLLKLLEKRRLLRARGKGQTP
jgi:DNA-binding transcriptional MerR regulator